MIKGGGKFFIILALICLGFFYWSIFSDQLTKVSASGSDSIVISEILVGQDGSANNEFIEIYKQNSQDINLAGYSLKKKTASGAESVLVSSAKFIGTIPAYGYFLISHSGYKDTISADLSYSSASYFISANNTVLLYNASSILFDKVGYGTVVDFEGITILEIANNKSATRIINNNLMVDTDNNQADFEIKDPNPQNSKSAKLIPSDNAQEGNQERINTEVVTPEIQTSVATEKPRAYFLGDIVINELVSDPGDDDVEWVELFNTKNIDIDLSNWTLEDGSGAKTILLVTIAGAGSNKFYVIEKPKGTLNNSGDLIILRDATGSMIDKVAYGNWDDGNTADNALVASDPKSLARKFDGLNSYNNINDFVVTSQSTQGQTNLIVNNEDLDESLPGENLAKYDYSNDIFISEIFPNPEGQDTGNLDYPLGEFVELYNFGTRDVNLLGWKIGNNQKTVKIESVSTSTVIKFGEYFLVWRKNSNLVLRNDTDSIKLFQPLSNQACQTVKYIEVKENWSYNLICGLGQKTDCLWQWSDEITSGGSNISRALNHTPVIVFDSSSIVAVGVPVKFDSSDTNDEDGDELKFSWDFGDGHKSSLSNPEHTFLKVGSYKVQLIAKDKASEAKIEKTITVVSPEQLNLALKEAVNKKGAVIINEILPNPPGVDDKEWVELKNLTDNKINLFHWKIADKNQEFKFLENYWLDPNNFFLVNKSQSRLVFNNTDDTINLYDDFNELIDELSYEAAVEGESYARGENNKFFWTTVVTPGEENIIEVANSQKVKSIKQTTGLGVNNKLSNINYPEVSLDKVSQIEVGSTLKVKGTVAVLSGILGAQYFYIVASSGIQVYNYKKLFPKLAIGDSVEVCGELAVSSEERRIKTKVAGDVKIVKHGSEPTATLISIDKLDEETIGNLISIDGEVTKKTGSTVYLDDGTDELPVFIKKTTGINLSEISVGQSVKMSGILGNTKSGPRLLPRFAKDVVINKIISASEENKNPEVLGEIASADDWNLPERDKNKELYKYLTVIGLGIVVVLVVFLFRKYKK